MRYKVKFADDELMNGREWVMCSKHDDGVVLYLFRGMVKLPDEERARILEEAWTGFRQLADVDEIPPQRAYRSSASAAP